MSKKIKVLHLIKSLGRGGAEKLIPETAKLHDQYRFEFHCIYFFHQPDYIIDELEDAGIRVHLIPSGNLSLFFQVKKIRQYILDYGINIIHSHLPWAGILGRLVGSKLEIPIVYTEHNTWDRYNKFSYWGNRLTFKKQDVAIAVSNEVALSMELNLLFDPVKPNARLQIKTIPNGVNIHLFQRNKEAGISIRKAADIPLDAFVIGKVAVFRDQKRLWLWIAVALEIIQQAPQTHFLLVGDGDWRDRIVDLIENSGKSSHFHMVGVQKQVVPYLSCMDLYMSSSEFEGLPVAMLEGMSCGLPVVATNAGGIAEVVQDGVEGYLCAVENWQALTSLALRLIQDAELHAQMASAARRRVEEEFSMERMVQQLERIYDQVLQKYA
ncbi:glycosyltransferase [Mongoliitalea daihaiensis]|uniref:glycosyltransferase n=1 Tax=Mongoliitalea daihaiensis TaxID=2782006 RepID=UPI001F24D333|nr:glycosyltransferase [Mongoliitalea daihaiensis]UJP64161.1 glycosyltransferase [Mongoliitalea daihaiensis]